MTRPTSTNLSNTFSNFDILDFDNGLEREDFSGFPNQVSLLNVPTNNAVISSSNKYFLEGSYNNTINVFTIGTGVNKLFWVGTEGEFLSVGNTGGDWELQV